MSSANYARSTEPAFKLPPLEEVNGEPQFRLFVVGSKAAGKTVFLASLYNMLTVSGLESKYFADLEEQDARYLESILDRITDLSKEWPEGNIDVATYVFRCFHNTVKVGRIPLFQFHYTDYPGGYVARRAPKDIIDVRKHVEAAHAILFLIDGQKIRAALERRPVEGYTINEDIDVIAYLANLTIYRPMQFLITKWDIIGPRPACENSIGHSREREPHRADDDEPKYSLKEIREFLMRNKKFKSIIEQRRLGNIPTYLIPVSAIGFNFVEYRSSIDRMVRKANSELEPHNIDTALALSVVSYLSLIKENSGFFDKLWMNALNALVSLVNAIKFFSDRIEVKLPTDQWALRISFMLGELSAILGDKAGDHSKKINERLSMIRNKNSALDAIIGIQGLLVKKYLKDEPAADLLNSEIDSAPSRAQPGGQAWGGGL